jgi:hypothetical protein
VLEVGNGSQVPTFRNPTHLDYRNPTLAKCEDETHTPKVGDLESSGTPECLEFDSKGQNTSPWGVLGVIGKVLKCRCPKRPRIGHLDICSSSYGQKKGRESNSSGFNKWTPGTLGHRSFSLRSGRGLNHTCSSFQELSTNMSHSRFGCPEEVNSRLLMVGSQTASLTPALSFAHNLGWRCPNDQCEAISDIYTSRPF